jgi:hypothetical protein
MVDKCHALEVIDLGNEIESVIVLVKNDLLSPFVSKEFFLSKSAGPR